ncbi:hypothetical protein ACN38_g4795 [Penicillium nordicum]|uniref:Uncharacterized protein n=1 Tax=Penicillium nordicum TaxID=229535 RepID=A0A0M8P9V8_9EURO|nr:hypothetical protein ACN38_g4795 [Penicillium nordicum]
MNRSIAMDSFGALIVRRPNQHEVMESIGPFTGYKNSRPLMRPCYVFLYYELILALLLNPFQGSSRYTRRYVSYS